MRVNKNFVTTKTYFDFSNKSFVCLKQFMYGNTFTVLNAFWVSLCNLFFFRVNSDKETNLVVFEKHNPSESSLYVGFDEKQDDVDKDDESSISHESSLVSISKRYEFFSDKSITGFVEEEPKALCFVFHDYSVLQEIKMVTFSDESNTSSIVLEKPFIVEKKFEKSQSEEMLVYEFMSCGVLKELKVQENFVGYEENLLDVDGFIELNPSLQISNPAYEEEEERFMQREEQLNMGFQEEQEVYDFDDDGSASDDDDDEFEHSDVIERLKTELRTARTGGLCTILEESETPLEELKPLKIEPKPDQLKDKIAEIHKVYKNYAVKMRKLDVIDSQTMHSISLLKLKDSSKRSRNTIKAPKSLLHQNLWPFKKHKLESDPIERLVKEASRDFEIVYVGQLCLSWEMLRWQYTKVLEFDSNVTYQYNLVAGEFQLFQVLLQRFVENEPFQNSSRVETYLQNRRHFHIFLQIPLVRDDRSSKSNKKCRNEEKFAVKIESLREIIQESMLVFWEFLCAEKNEFISSLMKVSHQKQVSPQDPLDLELLTEIKTNLQKKEKKLKEIVRSQSCIVKKLKKNESKSCVGLKDELLIAQIELRLVSRVMNMSKLTTEKLVWCQEKLSKIIFNGRRIHMEPSFSLLPC